MVLLFACTNGQSPVNTFIGQGGNITNDGIFTEFIIEVNDSVSRKLSSEFGLKEVMIDLDHDDLSEIVMYLKAPDGSEVELTYVNGPGAKHYRNTCFSEDAKQPIKCASPPFTGKYRPVDYLGSINNGQTMSGAWKLLVKDWKPSLFSGKLLSWKLTFGEDAPSPVILESSELPIVVINTAGNNIPDSPRIKAGMGIIHSKGKINTITDQFRNYSGTITIETRGSSSQNYSKKSYAFSTTDSTGKKKDHGLLDLPAEKDWILYAPYSDKSLLRNYLTYTLFGQMGHYSPRSRFVELVINGDYRGIYMLTEKIKRDENRINIAQQSDQPADPKVLSGGYIFKIDRFESDTQGFYSSIPAAFEGTKKVFYRYTYPDEDDINPLQKKYLQTYVDSFEHALISYDYNSEKSYRRYANLKSFVDFFLINEFSKNVDAYKLSTYLYKDRDDRDARLNIGPVWDYDLAWNNANYGNGSDPEGWQYSSPDTTYPVPQWWGRMMNDPVFKGMVKERWQQLRKGTLSNSAINSLIDKNTTMMKEATERNFRKWPVLGSQVGMNPLPLPADHKGEIDRLKQWVADRGAWMDAEIAKMK